MTLEKKDCLSHHEVMTRAEVYDGERGVKLVGHRGYFLRKWGVLLNQALINYGLHFLYAKGYDPIQPLLHEGRVYGQDGAVGAV